ncbi:MULTISPECIES: hypothetical protein [unclassified Aeromicrobium]|uniref:hypothetical protein n=1 Tax=unclassified Aeromicrobium TaxID=2633570 RepID=UPI00288984EC|nr:MULTISPECIES: hypothetical protein [unclassified Aeromicrobium]
MTTIATNDPRHGLNSGYVAGCRAPCCALAHFRANKERTLHRSRYGSCRHTHDEVLAVLGYWLQQGLTPHALAEAAGLARTDLAQTFRLKSPVNRGTFAKLRDITEDDLPDTALVNSDLTRRRIYSLMAGGIKQQDMPLNPRGTWRDRPKVQVQMARTIREFFQANEFVVGPSAHTAARARNAGHLPPIAWDDPGSLADIHDTFDVLDDATYVDSVVVERLLAGVVVPTTPAERRAVVAAYRESGKSLTQLAKATGWNPHRYTAEPEEEAA